MSEPALMSVAQARAILGPELVAEIETRPVPPLSAEQIARIAPLLRAVYDAQAAHHPAA